MALNGIPSNLPAEALPWAKEVERQLAEIQRALGSLNTQVVKR